MSEEIPYGYCHCGCGQKTNLAKYNDKKRSRIKDKPMKFLFGHAIRIRTKGRSKKWEGGEFINISTGYVFVYAPDHSNADSKGCVRKSRLIVERALGKSIPIRAEVHHFNEIKNDDRPNNLVLCQDRAYHMLLHRRQRALRACGHINWKKCPYCKEHDDPGNMVNRSNHFVHKECRNKHERKYWQKSKRR